MIVVASLPCSKVIVILEEQLNLIGNIYSKY